MTAFYLSAGIGVLVLLAIALLTYIDAKKHLGEWK